MPSYKLKIILLIVGDILILYLAIFLTLIIRYGARFYDQFINYHLTPFSFVFIIWLTIFYIAGLYDRKNLRNNLDFLKITGSALLVNAFLAISFFYLIPFFGITPKTNLFIFIVIFGILELFWRRFFNNSIILAEAPNKILLIGSGQTFEKVYETIKTNLHLGYEIKMWVKEDIGREEVNNLKAAILSNQINIVVIPRHLKKDTNLAKSFYDIFTMGVDIYDITEFYEMVFQKVPLVDLEEAWFLENLSGHQKFYDPLKRAGEVVFAIILSFLLLPLLVFIGILVKTTSRGPIIYKQVRVGKNNKTFVLYKFRSQKTDSEKNGPKWTEEGDASITAVGSILRKSHLDELPQLWNIIKGDLSFVGPRPERPEFTKVLAEKIPYYEIRHIIKPGVTGWAQINYSYGASIEDSYEKLQYDIYYVKNRSLALDLAIILKTAKSLIANPK